MEAQLVAMIILAITDRILELTVPDGVEKEAWRAEVQSNADQEEIWLKSIVK